jgi:hypothetical protein
MKFELLLDRRDKNLWGPLVRERKRKDGPSADGVRWAEKYSGRLATGEVSVHFRDLGTAV